MLEIKVNVTLSADPTLVEVLASLLGARSGTTSSPSTSAETRPAKAPKGKEAKQVEAAPVAETPVVNMAANTVAPPPPRMAANTVAPPAETTATVEENLAGEDPAPTVSLEQVRQLIMAKSTEVPTKRDGVKALLTKYGAVKATELKPADYAAIFTELNAL